MSMFARLLGFVLLGSFMVSTSACRYELAAPPVLGESMSITVVSNASRLVRSQAYLQQEVADAVRRRLGWNISPNGTASLQLFIERERIDVATTDIDDIPNNWSMTLRVKAVLNTSKHGSFLSDSRGTPFEGVGYTTTRLGEPTGIENASANVAAQVADWLENTAGNWEQ